MKKTILLATFLGSSLYADTAPVAPETPGIQLQKLNEIDKSVKPSKKSAIVDTLKVNKNVEGKGENRIKGPSFVLTNVSVTGNTVMDKKEIIAIIKPFVSKSVDSIDLKYIAQKITSLYKSKGYLTSKCIIPAQKVQNGNVKFQIIEDKLGRIIIKGKTKYNYDSNLFMKYLADLQGKIINADELNRQLKYLSNLPVTRIKPSLQKTNGGYTNLILEITESKENVSVSVDNSGSKYTGQNRITLNGNINNIRGKSDSLSLSLTTSKNPKFLTSFSTSYVTPVGRKGGRVVFGYSHMYYQLDPDEVGTDLVIYEGKTDTFSFNYLQPLYWFDKSNLTFNYGFEKRNTTANTIQNSDGSMVVNGSDNTFTLNSGLNFSKLDTLFGSQYSGINTINISFKKALEGFLDSMTQEDLTRKENDTTFPITGPIKYGDRLNPSFLKYYYSLSRQQQLPYATIMNLNLNGNYTKDRVPDSYEYSGGDFGYAYSMSLARKFWRINSSLSLSQSTVYTNEMDGTTTKVINSPSIGIGLNSSFDNIYLGLSYSSSLDNWDSNTNNIRYKLKYSW